MNRPNVIFLSDLPREREAKLAHGLRSRGIASLLVYVHEPNNHDPREFFEYTIKADNAIEAIGIIRKLRPDIVHINTYGADSCTYLMFKQKVGKVVYDYKDCHESVIGTPQPPQWYPAQREAIENADGLCCRDMQLWNYCRVNRIKPKGKTIFFHDYCWGDNHDNVVVRNDGEVHTVTAGYFTIERLKPEYADSGYLYIANLLASAGIHIHIYAHKHNQLGDPGNTMIDYHALAQRSPYVHIHTPVPMSRFVQEMSQYDFGLVMFQGLLFNQIEIKSALNGHLKHGIATRLYDYLEAGLDLMITPGLQLMYRLAREANVVVPATQEFFLKGNAKQAMLDRIHDNKSARINAARQKLSIKNNISRLIDFYKSL